MELLTFNVDDGFSEALIRGLRGSFIRKEDYDAMRDCNNLSDFKMVLEDTDYLSFIQNEPTPIAPAVIRRRMREKLAKELEFIRAQTAPELYAFLEKITHRYMIENAINLLEVIKNKDHHQKKPQPDPLGSFRGIDDILRYDGDDLVELYQIVLIDTPVGPYFQRYMEDLASLAQNRSFDEVHRQVSDETPQNLRIFMRKMWLEELYDICRTLNGTSREILEDLLKFEADCMTIQILYNSFNNEELNKPSARENERKALCPSFGYLHPDFDAQHGKIIDVVSLRTALEPFTLYSELVRNVPDPLNFDEMNDDTRKSIDDYMYETAVKKYSLAFDQQFHYAAFYAYLKLKEQEIRNVEWLANMVDMETEKSQPAWRKYEKLIPFYCLKE